MLIVKTMSIPYSRMSKRLIDSYYFKTKIHSSGPSPVYPFSKPKHCTNLNDRYCTLKQNDIENEFGRSNVPIPFTYKLQVVLN